MPTVFHTPLPPQAQVAYSELFESARFAALSRSVAELHGSFSRKTVKGRVYWYFAFRDALDGSVRQIYAGPDSPDLQRLIETAKQSPPATHTQLARQVRAALQLGCTRLVTQHFRIIRQIEQAGFFRAGGVLVGSHAFGAYANLLGVRWASATHTLDVDLAIGRASDRISLALPDMIDVDVPSAIESLHMGFIPHSAIGGASFGSRSDTSLRIDFLTPQGRKGRSEYVEKLKIPLQPMKFLDFLIESPTQGALLEANGGVVVVNLPDPARYAIHKLLVSGERPTAEQAKARKDLDQAAALIDYYLDLAPDRLVEALADAQNRGPQWRKRLHAQTQALLRLHPSIVERWIQHSATHTRA